jgi:hypothetical protein
LQTQQQDLQVAYRKYSEQKLLEVYEIRVEQHCKFRADGWIEYARLDKGTQDYLMFPGN